MYVRVPPLLSFSRVFARMRCHNPVSSVLAYDVASITELTDCQEGGEGKGAIGIHYPKSFLATADGNWGSLSYVRRDGRRWGERGRASRQGRTAMPAFPLLALSLWHEKAD